MDIWTIICEMNSTRPSRTFAHLLHPVNVQEMVRGWLKEDTPNFDYGGFVVGEREETALLICKSCGILAGTPFFDAVFNEVQCKVEWLASEGDTLVKSEGKHIAKVTGKVRHILIGERIALNCLCRASGIATYARKLTETATALGWNGEIAGTRKTTPGFRMIEKYALLVGGISTHRNDLSSMIMLKDNHIWSAGNITQAVQDAKSVGGFSTKIEVECRSFDEATEAIQAGADVIMLDNFTPQALHATAERLKAKHPHVLIESSGGISEDNIMEYMGAYVDIISLSAMTQGYQVVDFSLKLCKEGRDPLNPAVENICA